MDSQNTLQPERSSIINQNNKECNLQKLIDSSPYIICSINDSWNFITLNNACLSILGYYPEELIGKNIIDLTIEEDRAYTLEALEGALLGNSVTNFESRCMKKDGPSIPLVWSFKWEPSDKLLYCVARDATSKKVIENELINQRKRLSEATKIAGIGFWECDIATNQVYWSKELTEIYGLNDEEREYSFEFYLSITHPEDRAFVIEEMTRAIATGKGNFTHRVIKPEGEVIHVRHFYEIKTDQEGNKLFLNGTVQDITAQIEYEQNLIKSEQKFKALVEHSSDMIGIIDIVGNYIYTGENTEIIMGYAPESLIGRNAFDLIHPDDAFYVISKLSEIVMEKKIEMQPIRLRNSNGEWRWIETIVTNMSKDPAVKGIVFNSRDITEKKIASDQLQLHSLMANEAPYAIMVTTPSREVTWVNKAFEQLHGYTLNEIKGKKTYDFINLEGDKEVMKDFNAVFTDKKSFRGIIATTSKSGKKYWVEAQIQPILHKNGEAIQYFSILQDISERLQLEKRLNKETELRQKKITAAILKAQEKERAEISKELHDNVNQVLTTVKLYLEMAVENKDNSQSLLSKSIAMTNNCIDEIRNISKTLSSFALDDLDLKSAISNLVDSLSAVDNIQYEYKTYGLDNYKINDEIRLAIYRVVQEHTTNIIKHAKANEVNISLTFVADTLSLVIHDNGIGFDLNAKRKGIGISNMSNRIESLNGRLEIKSNPGNGCTLFATISVK